MESQSSPAGGLPLPLTFLLREQSGRVPAGVGRKPLVGEDPRGTSLSCRARVDSPSLSAARSPPTSTIVKGVSEVGGAHRFREAFWDERARASKDVHGIAAHRRCNVSLPLLPWSPQSRSTNLGTLSPVRPEPSSQLQSRASRWVAAGQFCTCTAREPWSTPAHKTERRIACHHHKKN